MGGLGRPGRSRACGAERNGNGMGCRLGVGWLGLRTCTCALGGLRGRRFPIGRLPSNGAKGLAAAGKFHLCRSLASSRRCGRQLLLLSSGCLPALAARWPLPICEPRAKHAKEPPPKLEPAAGRWPGHASLQPLLFPREAPDHGAAPDARHLSSRVGFRHTQNKMPGPREAG